MYKQRFKYNVKEIDTARVPNRRCHVATRCRDIAVVLANNGTVVVWNANAYIRTHDNRHKKFNWALETVKDVR